jgi:hypothetical protein
MAKQETTETPESSPPTPEAAAAHRSPEPLTQSERETYEATIDDLRSKLSELEAKLAEALKVPIKEIEAKFDPLKLFH